MAKAKRGMTIRDPSGDDRRTKGGGFSDPSGDDTVIRAASREKSKTMPRAKNRAPKRGVRRSGRRG